MQRVVVLILNIYSIIEILCIICVLFLKCILGQDFYYDENGKSYVIDSWGNRKYSGSDALYTLPSFLKPKMKIINFAMNLFKNVEGQNFVVSPISPQILLACLTMQSKGQTKEEMSNVTGYQNSEELEFLISAMQKEHTNRELKIGNGFFVEERSFDKLKSTFWNINDAPTRPIDVIKTDFKNINAAKKTYSKWVRSKTKNILKEVDTDFDSDTQILLASTLYFKGQWIFNFNTTQKSDFYLSPHKKVQVDTMRIQKKFHSGIFNNIKARWAAIPYNSTESMIVIMPNDDETINGVISKLLPKDIYDIIEVIRGPPTLNFLNITLPKFKLKSSLQLSETLQKMNVRKIFSAYSDLFIFNDNTPLKIGSALQQTFLEVNEEGSIGASVTSFSAVALSIQPEIKNSDFIVDRPFLAFIIDRKYGIPYFMAKVVDPR